MRSQVIKFRLASTGYPKIFSIEKITPGIAKTMYPQAAKLTLGNAPARSKKWNSVPDTPSAKLHPRTLFERFSAFSASRQYHRILNLANSVVSS